MSEVARGYSYNTEHGMSIKHVEVVPHETDAINRVLKAQELNGRRAVMFLFDGHSSIAIYFT